MHYFSHNIADYRKDTGHLTLLEHGIYRQLLDSYYLNEKPIETQRVMRRLQITTQEEKAALQNVLSDFFEVSDCGKFHTHRRCDVEITKYQARSQTSRVNGSKGGRPPKPKKTQQVNLANPEGTQAKGNHKPITNNQEPVKEKVAAKKPLAFSEVKNLNQPAWKRWVTYRREVHAKKPYKTLARANKLSRYSYDVQTEAVEAAIVKEWLDVYPEKILEARQRKASRTLMGKALLDRCEELGITTVGRQVDELYERIAKAEEPTAVAQ